MIKDYELRVLNEHAELNERIEKLEKFLESANAAFITQNEIDDFRQQHSFMVGYRAILHSRARKILQKYGG